MSLFALDIETACNVGGCTDKKCKHALIPHLGRITCIGVWSPEEQKVFRNLGAFAVWLADNPSARFVLHNGKFDFKFLWRHGADLPEDCWVADTCLMATASYRKVPEQWLEGYAARRVEANKKLPKGFSHREAGKHSLKVLAPYLLGVPEFWEDPANHDSDEYVLKDCEYTYRLYDVLKKRLEEEETYDFYEKRLLPWAKMFLRAEHRGILLDGELLKKKEKETAAELVEIRAKLDAHWGEAYKVWEKRQALEIRERYHEMFLRAREKAKNPTPEKLMKIAARYSQLAEEALKTVEPINLDSPKQMAWLLRDHFGLDIVGFDGKESTGVEVLERLAAGPGREDLRVYLRYRELEKLTTAFFPTYRSLRSREGALHCSFNLDITKTGRVSSDTPNLQQCPGDLHSLFVARPGYKLITKDFSSIEPYMICYYSEDKTLFELLNSGADFHGFCTNAIFDTDWDLKTLKSLKKAERAFAKEVDLAVFYGAGKNRVKQSSQKHGFNFTLDQADRAVKRLRDAWPGVIAFKKYTDRCAEAGEPIEAILGRKRLFPDPDDIFMQAFNSRIQGSASDLLLFSVQKAEERFKTEGIEAHLLILVHDEVVVEAREDHLERADAILTDCLTGHKLTTQWGDLKLKAEGKNGHSWEK